MGVKVHRKLVLTYKPIDEGRSRNMEMGFATGEPLEGPARVFPSSDTDVNYAKYISKVCSTLNKEIAKLVDHAEFHIVEVRIIK